MSRYDRQRHRHPGLAQRAQHQGRIATQADRRAAQRQIGHIQGQAGQQVNRIQRQGQNAARSARRMTQRQAAFERGINLQGTGTGQGLFQRQLNAGARSVEQYGKGLASLARKGARLDVRDVNQQAQQDIYNTRESVRGIQQQATASALNDLVTRRRQTQQDAAAQAQQAMLDKIQAQRGRQRDRFQAALGAVGNLLEKKVPSNDREWGLFRAAVHQANPLMSPRDIEAAINHVKTKQTKQNAPDVLDYWRRLLGLGG